MRYMTPNRRYLGLPNKWGIPHNGNFHWGYTQCSNKPTLARTATKDRNLKMGESMFGLLFPWKLNRKLRIPPYKATARLSSNCWLCSCKIPVSHLHLYIHSYKCVYVYFLYFISIIVIIFTIYACEDKRTHGM